VQKMTRSGDGAIGAAELNVHGREVIADGTPGQEGNPRDSCR
jgi:hypothetical protein